MRGFRSLTLATLALAIAVQATFYKNPSAVANKAYDFIVVGVRPVLFLILTPFNATP